jgi:DNA-binding MarR family transcriptional regulator
VDSSLSTENEIVASIRQIVRAVDMHSRHLVEVFGLTGPQVATLQEVVRLGPTPVTALARSVHLSPGTVSGIVQRLERRGLLQRERSDTDRRTVLISITVDGQRVVDAAPSLLQDRFREELERLEDWERLMILSTLKRIAGLMGAEQIATEPHLITDTVSLPQGGEATIDADALASKLDTPTPVTPDGIDDASERNPMSEAP